MSATGRKNWTTISESRYAWERDALEFIKQGFPAHEPYRAWSNFEFIADDGSINEVDLLVFSPQGFFLIEIKSRPGRLSGDAGTWTFEHEGRRITFDNPLLDANRKAKKLNALLLKQKAVKSKGKTPFIEPLVFCSDPNLICDLQGNARARVCLRDREEGEGRSARPGILAAITRRECPGLTDQPKGQHDKPMAKLVTQALEQAGIRAQQRHRNVSDYELDEIVYEGRDYQDWKAHHVQVKTAERLVRLYTVDTGADKEKRRTIERAAKREFQLLETLQHPGILQAHAFTEHELGPALILEHDPAERRLDHYLTERGDTLSASQRLYLIRQIAEVVRFAHEKKVIHRSLSPRAVLVRDSDTDHPKVRVFNWQIGHWDAGATSTSAEGLLTTHIDQLVEDASTAFMAPEVFAGVDELGEHVDVFSLGALAYYIFSGAAPAENAAALSETLRGANGLQISAVLNGASEALQELIEGSTHPDVSQRLETVHDFLEHLDYVDEEVNTPDYDYLDNPLDAQAGDLLPNGFKVVRRLGQGSTSIAMLVERDGERFVLKTAMSPEHNDRIETERAAIEKLHHQYIVVSEGPCHVGDHAGFLVKPVFQNRESAHIETLGDRIRREGPLHIDLLQRFGDDLIDVVCHLEEQGIAHRDIKPDNIAVGQVGGGNKLHAVLFDFSLTGLPADNIRAGTKGYRDPFLSERKRWDLAAERYAAAVTLHEMATGALPRWGDGKSDPSLTGSEVTLDSELFDTSLRDQLTACFQRAFKRDAGARFDNAEEMRHAWTDCFKNIEQPGGAAPEDQEALNARLDAATPATSIYELGLGARATNALERANLLTVQDLLEVNPRTLQRLRGVGNKTRREITAATRRLRKRLGGLPASDSGPSTDAATEETIDPAAMSVDLLVDRVTRPGARDGESARRALFLLLGLEPDMDQRWPSQVDVAKTLELTRAAVGQFADKFRARWDKERAVTQLRTDIAETLEKAGGVMALHELAQAVLGARGSVLEEPERTQRAEAVIRVASEVEHAKVEPRFLFRRCKARVILALGEELADYAMRLGKAADKLAGEDPLPAPQRVLDRLRAVKAPKAGLPDARRMARLAAAASQDAALSSLYELYPRGMKAERALKLSQGALLGVRFLRIEQVRERVRSRYPEAEPLPDRPQLDALLKEAGLLFEWNPSKGCYELPSFHTSTRTDSTDTTLRGGDAEQGVAPELADARQFEERLRRAAAEGAFLALIVSPKRYVCAVETLGQRFPVEPIDVERVFLDALWEEAEKAKVNWDLVLQADATPGEGDWDKLLLLVRRAMPHVEARLRQAERTILLLYPGVLARYEQMDLLERLRDEAGRRGGIPGLWPLIPGDSRALIGARPLPILGPNQCVRVPNSWPSALHEPKTPEPAKA